jgi:NADH:ubiquinone oxidoreductase subunit 3 (subunit A)
MTIVVTLIIIFILIIILICGLFVWIRKLVKKNKNIAKSNDKSDDSNGRIEIYDDIIDNNYSHFESIGEENATGEMNYYEKIDYEETNTNNNE